MPRESGRPCGCDPAADHVCTQHAAYFDGTTVEFTDSTGATLVVSGPDEDGEFMILIDDHEADGDAAIFNAGRFVLEDIIEELQRRLTERA